MTQDKTTGAPRAVASLTDLQIRGIALCALVAFLDGIDT